MSIYFDPKRNNPPLLSENLYTPDIQENRPSQILNQNKQMIAMSHKKGESTYSSQYLNDSSLEISPNSSGILILEQLEELKRLFKPQEEEFLK